MVENRKKRIKNDDEEKSRSQRGANLTYGWNLTLKEGTGIRVLPKKKSRRQKVKNKNC